MKALDYDGLDHVVDKIYDLINSGGSADYIVEEGTSGIWTYRKWASGIAECWGDDTQSVVAYANVLTGAKNFRKTVNLPSNLFTQIDDVNFNCVVAGTTTFPVNIGGSSTTSLDIIATALTTATTAQTFRSRMLVKGLWKEFTPSVSAKAQVGFEDLSDGMTPASGMSFDSNHSNRCRRFGNLCFACGRVIVNTAKSSYMGGAIATLPNTAQYGLVGWLFFSNSSTTGSADRCYVNGNQVCQNYASNLPAGTAMEFILIYVVAD